jgi:PAS domain S-box-containing protein
MKESKDKPAAAAALRHIAEERLKARETTPHSALRNLQSQERLVHELQVHQIELEMQNEELQQARAKADALLAQYTDLYDFAPTGYLTLDREGAIRQVNLTGALLLGGERSRLVNRRFGLFVAESDRRAFDNYLEKVFASEAKESCEVTLPREGSQPVVVRIEGRRSEDGQECRAVVLDITGHRHAEEQARAAQVETQRLLALSDQSRKALLSALEDQKQIQIARDRLLRCQITLNRATLALGALTELPAILRTLHDEVRTLLDADGFFVSRYHKDTQLITALFAIDEGGERDVSTFPPIPLAPEGRGMQSQVLRTAKPLNVPDWIEGEHRMQTVHHIAADGTFTPPPPETERDGCTKSALLVPLLFRGEPIGVLQAQSNRLNAYSDEDVDLLAGLGNVAAISIQNALLIAEAARAEETLRLSLEGTLHAVSAAAETRDPYTAGHQRRATDLAIAIARVLGCSDDECNTLRIAGTVHDIGKLAIPAEILSKPGTLAPIELALIREHPQTAYDILADVPFPGPVAEIVLQHHERLDGSGYPRGLKGDQVLREARGIDVALGEIEQNAALLYDSEAVEACLHLFRDKGYALPA